MKHPVPTLLLLLIFVASGSAKLASLQFELVAFARWGYPLWAMYLIGVVEVLGGLLLLWPRFTSLVAAGLGCFMFGAIATHVVHAEWPMTGVATAIMALGLWRGWLGREDVRALLAPGAAK
jgi:putative oxidoreductase